MAAERSAKTYCIVISARGPNEREMTAVEAIVPEIKQQYGLNICACLGLLTDEQAQRLKACGVDRVNHNLNTERSVLRRDLLDPHLRRTARYAPRGPRGGHGALLRRDHRHGRAARAMWSTWPSSSRELGVESIPVNFLNPIDGTPLDGSSDLDPRTA